MSKGAAHCGLSQSAATQHVQEVERRLGLPLFDRTRRPLVLTPAGKIYAEFCRDVLERERELELNLESLKAEFGGIARVASIYSIGLSEMSGLQELFSERHPAAQLHVEYMRPDKIYEAVMNDSADVGLVSYPVPSREIAVIPWRNEEMQVAVPPSHALASRDVVYPEDLAGLDFIAFDEDLSIRRELDRFFKTQGVDVNAVLHFDNIQMIKEAVAHGSGISILPARTMRAELAQGRLVALRLRADLVRPVGVVHRRRKRFNRATQSFLELLTATPTPEAPSSELATPIPEAAIK